MKLISLIEFVLEKNEGGLFKYNDEKIRRYAEFLSQELTLSMFLPCDENDNLIDEPSCFSHFMNGEITRIRVKITDKEVQECEKYKRALDNVLFEPVTFDTLQYRNDIKLYSIGNTQVFNLSDDKNHLYWHCGTIEDLLHDSDDTIYIKQNVLI